MPDEPAAPLPAAVVFDCDGTLVDSESVTRAAMSRALAEQGRTLTEADFASMLGRTWPATRARMASLYDMDAAALDTYLASVRRHAHPLLDDPGLVFDDAVATLDELSSAGVPVAVCTSSGREHLARVLRLPGLVDRFEVRVAREDVAEHKPSPTPYLRALALLGERHGTTFPPDRCAVVEDSAPGVAAGRAAGCWTVAVDRGTGLHDLTHADRVVRRISVAALVAPAGATVGPSW